MRLRVSPRLEALGRRLGHSDDGSVDGSSDDASGDDEDGVNVRVVSSDDGGDDDYSLSEDEDRSEDDDEGADDQRSVAQDTVLSFSVGKAPGLWLDGGDDDDGGGGDSGGGDSGDRGDDGKAKRDRQTDHQRRVWRAVVRAALADPVRLAACFKEEGLVPADGQRVVRGMEKMLT